MNGKVGKMKTTELVDGAFEAKATEIKAVVAEIAEAEDGIAKHRAGIMTLTATLIAALYHLGSLLMALPGASANLKQARGAWLKRAVALCGNKNRAYMARDVVDYFDDPSDPDTRASGATGAERAAAFGSNLSELERLIKEKKDDEAEKTKRDREQRERQAAEAAKVVDHRGPPPPRRSSADRATTRRGGRARPSTEAHEPESGLIENPTRLEPEAQAEPNDKTENRDIRAVRRSTSSACSATTFSRPSPT